jgi:predicted dehydrogenase
MNPVRPTRREFLRTSTRFAAVSALAGIALPHVHAQGTDVLQVALIGCGGRGAGAASNALSVNTGPVKLVAMADVFAPRLTAAYDALKRKHAASVDVPEDRKFVGFDAYKGAMDCLRPGDIAIFTTPLAFRWVHFAYAIAKKLNVFMEKPLTADGPTSRRMIQLAEEATAQNLKVGVGLMSRHSRALQELHQRIGEGEIGDITLMRGYRMAGPLASAFSEPNPGPLTDLMYQVRRFHSFIWLSGGCYSDFYIHHIDHLCWMKNAWPVKAQGIGGRHYRQSPAGKPYIDQNFDSYAVEYTFADGAKLMMNGRCVTGSANMYYSHAQGTKGMAVVSKQGDCGLPSSIYSGQLPTAERRLWESVVPTDQQNPYQNEWNALTRAIRHDTPFNEVKRGVEASVATSMGRFAAHTGQEITWDQFYNNPTELAPGVDQLTLDGPSPLLPDADGRYPIPEPGIKRDREY